MEKIKLKIYIDKILMYFILGSFLFPRGFFEKSKIYKLIGTGCVYLALIAIGVYAISELRLQDDKIKQIKHVMIVEIWCALYFVSAIVITVMTQKGVHEGLQTLFATPMLCLYCFIVIQKKPREFISALTNILSSLFILSIFVFSRPIMYHYVGEHIIFIGHIQVAAQYGIIGALVAWIGLYTKIEKKIKSCFLLFLSIVLMITSDSASAIIVALIICAGGILLKKGYYNFFSNSAVLYVVGSLVLSGMLVVWNERLPYIVKKFLNARHTIWKLVMEQFHISPIYGYGIEGIKIKTYWNAIFNYAHSQFGQNLLDGGILLLILFYAMLILCAIEILKEKNKKLKAYANVTMCSLLLITLFDSISYYPYYVFILVICTCLQYFCNTQKKLGNGENEHGSVFQNQITNCTKILSLQNKKKSDFM